MEIEVIRYITPYIKGTDVIVTDILYSKSDIDRRLEDFEGQQGL